jgi:hypothetical protein
MFYEDLLENWKYAVKTDSRFSWSSIVYPKQATMSTIAIVSSSNLDINKLSFGDIRLNKAGGKSVPLKYNGQPLQIRLEKSVYPMGVNVKETENGTTYTMNLTLKGCDAHAQERAGAEVGSTGVLYNFLHDLQGKILDTAEASSVKWFGKARSRPVLEEMMKKSISPSVEKINGEWVASGKYPPSLKMKVPVYDGRVAMDVADGQGRPVEVTTENIQQVFPKRVEASIVVSPSIYVSGQGFGVTWRVSYARVAPPQRTTAAQIFADEIEQEIKGEPLVETQEEEEQEEVTVAYVEAPSAPPVTPTQVPVAPVAPAAPAKNRRRVAVA